MIRSLPRPRLRGPLALAATLVLGASACRTVDPAAERARVDAWLAAGRAHLRAEEPDRALALFERAAEREESLRTRLWVLRAWMDQGRSNDVLDALDTLRDEGVQGVELDYLYGMAFAQRARDMVRTGTVDHSVRMNFIDAARLLDDVTARAGERFPDAWLSLARAAWSNRDTELARRAAEAAVAAYPGDGDVWVALGRVAMSQFVNAQREAEWSETATAHWERAVAAFRRAIAVLGIPADERRRALLARAGLELGHALAWKERLAEAADHYALAIAFDPQGPDYKTLHTILAPPDPADEAANEGAPTEAVERGDEPDDEEATEAAAEAPDPFLRALEAGALAFHARVGLDDPRDGTLLWWLGWARHRDGRHAAAIDALLASTEKLPEAANTWVYVALAHYDLGDYDAASEALVRGWEIDAPAVVVEMQRDRELNVAKIDWLISQVPDGDLLERAQLSEICAEVAIDEPRHWNNMALFLRDAAEERLNAGELTRDAPEYRDLCERSYQAYLRALEITPQDPQLLNDAAVILHYYLDRSHERALEMYDLAAKLAEAHLDDPDLDPRDRERFEIALRDARNNEALLREQVGKG